MRQIAILVLLGCALLSTGYTSPLSSEQEVNSPRFVDTVDVNPAGERDFQVASENLTAAANNEKSTTVQDRDLAGLSSYLSGTQAMGAMSGPLMDAVPVTLRRRSRKVIPMPSTQMLAAQQTTTYNAVPVMMANAAVPASSNAVQVAPQIPFQALSMVPVTNSVPVANAVPLTTNSVNLATSAVPVATASAVPVAAANTVPVVTPVAATNAVPVAVASTGAYAANALPVGAGVVPMTGVTASTIPVSVPVAGASMATQLLQLANSGMGNFYRTATDVVPVVGNSNMNQMPARYPTGGNTMLQRQQQPQQEQFQIPGPSGFSAGGASLGSAIDGCPEYHVSMRATPRSVLR